MITPEEKTVIYEAAVAGNNNRAGLAAIRGEDGVRRLSPEETAEADRLIASLREKGIFLVTVLSEDYPEALRFASDPPLLLYGMGRRELLKARKFCIVGSRITPPWAEKVGRRLSEELSERFAIVTGFAEGGDAAAVAGAMPSGNLIVVLPCGIDSCYPAAHASLKERVLASKGLILSEYGPETATAKWAFPQRNRILAGLSEGVLVLSAGRKSGALITAGRALDCGRDVFALPYNVGISQGEGCNGLIKAGAYLVTSSADIFAVYGIETKEREEAAPEGDEGRILTYLRENGETHVAALAEALQLRIFETSALLSSLEIKGLVTKSGGNKYAALS